MAEELSLAGALLDQEVDCEKEISLRGNQSMRAIYRNLCALAHCSQQFVQLSRMPRSTTEPS